MYAVNVTSPAQLPLVSGCRNSGVYQEAHQYEKLSSCTEAPVGFFYFQKISIFTTMYWFVRGGKQTNMIAIKAP